MILTVQQVASIARDIYNKYVINDARKTSISIINSGFKIVDTYADLLNVVPLSYPIIVRVTADEQNNPGNMTEYRLYPDGEIMYQASININDI